MQADCKFLIFAHHQPMLDSIHQFLKVSLELYKLAQYLFIFTMTSCFPEEESELHSDRRQYTCSIKASFGHRFSGKRFYEGSCGMEFFYHLNLIWFSIFIINHHSLVENCSNFGGEKRYYIMVKICYLDWSLHFNVIV